MEVSGEAADLVMKEGVQISEEAIKLLARGAKNLVALLYAPVSYTHLRAHET